MTRDELWQEAMRVYDRQGDHSDGILAVVRLVLKKAREVTS